MSNLYAIIAEGNAEEAIIDLLLDNDKLLFGRNEILDDKVLKCRSGKNFCEQNLNFQFDNEIIVYRILDSRKENFVLPQVYQSKVHSVNVITRPEIELLIIISEKLYGEYNKSKMKPSEFLASKMKKFSKSYTFYYTYFSDVDKLLEAINEYTRITKVDKNEKTLADILK